MSAALAFLSRLFPSHRIFLEDFLKTTSVLRRNCSRTDTARKVPNIQNKSKRRVCVDELGGEGVSGRSVSINKIRNGSVEDSVELR